MYSSINPNAFLEEINGLDPKLKNARLSSVEINKKEKRIKYTFISENFIDDALMKKAWALARKNTSPLFEKVNVYFNKIVSDPELIENEIFKYVNSFYPSLTAFFTRRDVRASKCGEGLIKYTLKMTADCINYIEKSGVLFKINEYLSKKFCSDFVGVTEEKAPDQSISLLNDEVYESQLEKVERRTIKVSDVYPIDDPAMGTLAVYIEDALCGNVTIAGTITEITERETKNGKPFFVIHIDDTTGKTSGVYFSKARTLDKIRALKEGDEIIACGNIGDYNGKHSFTIDKINRCVFPKDFVKQEKFKKTAPPEYKTIFPKKAETIKVNTVFDEEYVFSDEFVKNDYVVFDLETTGLDVMNNSITEIGAVKIKKGVITEEFSTLIKPEHDLTEKIIALTGITPEMVKNAPEISAVIPDFMKFIDGAIIIAHNAEFDVKFIKKFAAREEYEVNNKVLDTVELSRKYLPQLKHNNLDALAEYFSICFNHHRALDDAKTTAEVFLEIEKIKENKEGKKV